MKLAWIRLSALLLLLGLSRATFAESALSSPTGNAPLRTSQELDDLVEPVALYPDPLLAQLLPAATFPAEIVLAARYLNADAATDGIDAQPWDSSVQALAHYPDVIRWMDENLSWTVALGRAFLEQEKDVLDSIQRVRTRLQASGNLLTSAEENIISEDGVIEILPANPEIILVPEKRSTLVIIHSKSKAVPTRRLPMRTGTWLNHDFDWPNHRLIVWGSQNPRPSGWWSFSHKQRHCLGAAHPATWRSTQHPNTNGPRRGGNGMRHGGPRP